NEDLPHFHQISPTFYRGAQPTQKGFELLACQGVKTIIKLLSADEKSQLEEKWTTELALRYYHLPLNGRTGPTDAEVQAVLSAINAPENQPVFLHCKLGKDRTGTIVACYRIAHDHWTGENALKEAKSLRLGWSEFGMKRYIRDFSRRPPLGGSAGISGELPQAESKPRLSKER